MRRALQDCLARFGRYEARSLIGDGAMGRVYEAWDPLLSRVVAVKAMKSEHLDPRTAGESLRRFGREAQAAGTLSHPAIVKVFDVGPDYLVMEKIEGPTLRDLLQTQSHFEPEQVVRILGPIAEALDHAHRAGVIHRDVKPANIILQPDGTPKLMDFGVAYVASSIVTAEGEVVGSPCYMSPEQIIGEDSGGAADVYALAVVAYEMLTGHPPFLGSVTQVIYKVVHEPAPLVREANPALPARYDEVLARALDKHAGRRFASAAELVAELAPRGPGERLAAGADSAPPRPAFPLVDTLAWPSPAGWYANVETVAWVRLAAAGRRASTHRGAIAFAALLGLAATASALLTRDPVRPESTPQVRPPAAPRVPIAPPPAPTPETNPAPVQPRRARRPSPPPAVPLVMVSALAVAPAQPSAAVPPVLRGDLVELGPDVTPPRQLTGQTVMPRPRGRLPLNGTVTMSMLVDENGVPTELQVVESAGEPLDSAALASARTWHFEPARKGGVPVRVRYVARQTYRLTP